jgi:hypothetical protein
VGGGGWRGYVVRYPCERVSDSRHTQALGEFLDFVFE